MMNDIIHFLNEYSLIEYKEKDANFFQIARFPHYENVSSNILAYFFKNKYVIKSFLNCISQEYDLTRDYIEDIIREEVTENNKRIDLLIYTNKYVIGIENKINAVLNNPIEDYYDYLKKIAKDKNKEPLFIVLSKNSVKKNENYCTILYKDFVLELKKRYSDLLDDLGNKYFLLLSEYVDNIETLHGGHQMNEEFVKIAQEGDNANKILQIVAEAERLRKDFDSSASQIFIDLSDYGKSFKNKWIYRVIEDIGYLGIVSVFQDCFFESKKYNLTIDVNIGISGYRFSIFERNGVFDEKFKAIVNELIPNIKEDYDLGERYFFKNTFVFNKYDDLICTLKKVLKSIDDYVESKKTSYNRTLNASP